MFNLFRKKEPLFRDIDEMREVLFDMARYGFLLHSVDANGENLWQLHPRWHDVPQGEVQAALAKVFAS